MKVFLAFVYFIGSVLIIFALYWFAPEEYVLDKTALVVKDNTFEQRDLIFPDLKIKKHYSYAGSSAGIKGEDDVIRVWLLVFSDKKQAESAFETYVKDVETNHVETKGSNSRFSVPAYYSYIIPGFRGRIRLIGEAVLHIEGQDKESIDQAFRKSGFFVPNPEANFLTKLVRTPEYFLHYLIFLLGYIALQVPLWSRVASWAVAVKPVPGVEPVGEEELRRRIFSINELDVPFRVIEGKRGTTEVVWRLADARWLGLMTANRLLYVKTLRMKFTEKDRTCRSIDISKRVEYYADGSAMLRFKIDLFRGITFAEWEYAKEYGLVFKDGSLKVDTAYEYKFDIKEMKNPVVNIVSSSGWRYKPVVTLFKFLGG